MLVSLSQSALQTPVTQEGRVHGCGGGDPSVNAENLDVELLE